VDYKEHIVISGQRILPEEKLTDFVRAKFRYVRYAINILNIDREGSEKCLPAAENIKRLKS